MAYPTAIPTDIGIVSPAVDLTRRERLTNDFARVTQFLTWPFLFVIFHIFFRIKVRGRENFDGVVDPFIIIANHTSFYDSFLFRLALGFNTSHLPLRFMAVNKFRWRSLNFLSSIGVIDFVYSLFGVFTIVPGRGIEANLEKARRIIAIGGNVVVYPEGKIFIERGIGPFKKGAAVLARRTGAKVVPVSFKAGSREFIRRKLVITVGQSIAVPDDISDEAATAILRDKVIGLYEND